ncbi:MAG: hypothetical protein HWE24_16625 [Oceanospirillaceae bacterium]|nr:hypothetical protein [Oceanospirillaceae bacterium]
MRRFIYVLSLATFALEGYGQSNASLQVFLENSEYSYLYAEDSSLEDIPAEVKGEPLTLQVMLPEEARGTRVEVIVEVLIAPTSPDSADTYVLRDTAWVPQLVCFNGLIVNHEMKIQTTFKPYYQLGSSKFTRLGFRVLVLSQEKRFKTVIWERLNGC